MNLDRFTFMINWTVEFEFQTIHNSDLNAQFFEFVILDRCFIRRIYLLIIMINLEYDSTFRRQKELEAN